MSDATSAHPAFNRILYVVDLQLASVGTEVIDAYGIHWTRTAAGTWASIVEPHPGLSSSRLIKLAGPIRLLR
jgi:hypothetical protein